MASSRSDYARTDPWWPEYLDDVVRYGPLPPGWTVAGDRGRPYYLSPGSSRLDQHPLNDSGGHDVSSIEINEENPTSIRKVIGVKHPPLYLRLKDWIFIRKTGDIPALSALFATLIMYKIISKENKNAQSQIVAVWNEEKEKERQSGPMRLYHPADALLITSFRFESLAARVARRYNRNLILLCPEIKKDLSDWDSIYEDHVDLRSAMRFRHSAGRQEDLPPILMGCLPAYGSAKTGETHWYAIEPRTQPAKQALLRWVGEHKWSKQEAIDFGLGDCNPDDFQRVIVAAHRAMLHDEIDEAHLGNWIFQFGKYFLATKVWSIGLRPRFSFAPGQDYGGRTISFAEISAMVLTSAPNSTAKKMARRWDAAVETLDQCMGSTDSQQWDKFRSAMMEISG